MEVKREETVAVLTGSFTRKILGGILHFVSLFHFRRIKKIHDSLFGYISIIFMQTLNSLSFTIWSAFVFLTILYKVSLPQCEIYEHITHVGANFLSSGSCGFTWYM